MVVHAYTEDQLVEQPAIGLFAELGWSTVSALEETFDAPSPGLAATLSHPMGEGASLGRETKGEVVLVSRLRASDRVSEFVRGKTKATEYFVEPQVLRTLEFQGETTLKGIERHRLCELILRDLEIYRKASISQIHNRIGNEIPRRKLQHELKLMLQAGNIGKQGVRKHTVYLCTKAG
jgi:hypothetical protein